MLNNPEFYVEVEVVSSDFSKHETAVFLLFGLIINPSADNFCDPDDAAANSSFLRFFFFGLELPWLTREEI